MGTKNDFSPELRFFTDARILCARHEHQLMDSVRSTVACLEKDSDGEFRRENGSWVTWVPERFQSLTVAHPALSEKRGEPWFYATRTYAKQRRRGASEVYVPLVTWLGRGEGNRQLRGKYMRPRE